MKILLSNKFYYRRGGDCICTLNLEELLQKNGHEVAIFAMQHPDTLPTPWYSYFPSEIVFKPGPKMFEAFMRPFGSKEVREKFNKLINDFKPDVVHLNNIHSQLSPIIAEIAHKKGIKVVWTLHDYKLLCPRYDCLRNGEDICEECFTDKKNVLVHKCMKNSIFASILAYQEATKWTRSRVEAATDTFICPSQFMADKLTQGGFDKNKMEVVCNFIDVEKCKREEYPKEDYYCYIGRLSHEKGIKTLVEVARQLPYTLKIIGIGPLEEDIRQFSQKEKQIEILGYKQWGEIKEIVSKARFSVIPSECYENNPLSVIESQCLGTPVLGAMNGGIPELIENEVSGMLFEPKNRSELKEKIVKMFSYVFNYQQLAKQAQDRYNAEDHYRKIVTIYSSNNDSPILHRKHHPKG